MKLIKILATVGLFFSLLSLTAKDEVCEEIIGDGFEKEKINYYFEKAVPKGVTLESNINDKQGQRVIFKQGITGSFRFKKIPIKPKLKYKLTFKAKVIGDDVIEKNPRIDTVQVVSKNILWRWAILFFDTDGKSIPRPIQATHLCLVSNQWKEYTSVFHSPPKAAYMQLIFNNYNLANGMELDNIEFGLCPDEGAINCNPDFRYGSHNYAGWKEILRGGLLLDNEKDKYLFDTAYGSVGEKFPLSSDGTYRLYARGTRNGRYSVVNIFFNDINGKYLKTITVRGTPEGKYVDFVLPSKTTSAYFRVYNHLLTEVRLTKIGDKPMFE
ncbi:MAG: hypothetical protein U9O87_03570 [Verrucomicrobiota bacterium]|nr:hypothetical protein [Verrucomicrobiota bacterium]